MRTNQKSQTKTFTYEGAPTNPISSVKQLERSVMSCMLWESEFYEDGENIADRIENLINLVDTDSVYNIAVKARNESKLRHIPLFIAVCMARNKLHRHAVGKLLPEIIQRADELTEFMALYWKGGKCPIAKQVKVGLSAAFRKFNEYQLAKYNRKTDVKLKDVLFLVHPKPKDREQQDLWNRLVSDELAVPDTWEVSLSSGGDKKESWTRLLKENKLGSMALLRNLRNMAECKVNEDLIKESILNMDVSKVLPFRFIASAKHAPQYERELESAMFSAISELPKLSGHTIILVDVSGSMTDKISVKSDMDRIDAACGIAMIATEICEKFSVFSFSNQLVYVPPRRGFALKDAIVRSQCNGGTNLGSAVRTLHANSGYDRIIVITDEQTCEVVPNPKGLGYMINVSSYQNGIGYGPWTHINGWSENVLSYVHKLEESEK